VVVIVQTPMSYTAAMVPSNTTFQAAPYGGAYGSQMQATSYPTGYPSQGGGYAQPGSSTRAGVRMPPISGYAQAGYPNQGYPNQGYPNQGYPNQGTVDPWSSPRVRHDAPQKISVPPGQSFPEVGYVATKVDPVNGGTYHERVIQEGTHKVFEKVIEMPKRVVQERVVEVPEIEYVTKVIEVPEVVYQENIVEKVVEQIQYRVVPVPVRRVVKKTVEVPEVQYIDVPVERIVEVPEYRDEVVVRQVEVPQYVEVPYPEYREVPVPHEIERHLPVPVEVTATFEYRMPCIRPVYKEVPVPIYVPRYIEVPVPAHMMDPDTLRNLDDRVNQLARNPHTSLDDLTRLAEQARGLIPG